MPPRPLPLRNWGEAGIVKDVTPFDLPPHVWSGGRNVIFRNKTARRAPAFRLLDDIDGDTTTPDAIFSLRPTSGNDETYVADDQGQVWLLTPGSGLSDVTDVGFTPISGTNQFTSAVLSGVLYVNRETHPIRYRNTNTGIIEDLPQWPSDYRANIIRPFKDFLMAFGITKGASEYNSTFKWSNAVTAGNTPDTWDPTVVDNNLAGETTIAEMDSAIIDAAQLRDVMVIYGANQVWAVEYTGDKTFPFAQRKLFNEGGAMGRNCAVEVNGRHYVFGPDDIYVHDGIQKQSISQGRIRAHVFNTMNKSLWYRCFVAHDVVNRLILFCYVSQDDDVVFHSDDLPNKAAVYSYEDDTWGFMELPRVAGFTRASAAILPTWAGATQLWGQVGGTWGDLEDGQKDTIISVCRAVGAVTTARVHALDGIERGTRIVAPLDADANSLAYLERVGIDLDEMGAPVGDFKMLDRMQMQMRTFSNVDLDVSVGASTFQQLPPDYDVTQSFAPQQDVAVDAAVSGRYVAIKIEANGTYDFDVTGADLFILPNGSL